MSADPAGLAANVWAPIVVHTAAVLVADAIRPLVPDGPWSTGGLQPTQTITGTVTLDVVLAPHGPSDYPGWVYETDIVEADLVVAVRYQHVHDPVYGDIRWQWVDHTHGPGGWWSDEMRRELDVKGDLTAGYWRFVGVEERLAASRDYTRLAREQS